MRLTKLCIWGLVASVAFIGIAVGILFWPTPLMQDPEIVLATAVFCFLFCGAAMVFSAIRDRGHLPNVMIGGIALTGLSMASLLAMIFTYSMGMYEFEEYFVLAEIIFGCGAGFILLWGLLRLPARRATWWRVGRTGAVIGGGVLAGYIVIVNIIGVMNRPWYFPFTNMDFDEGAWRVGLMIALPTASAMLVTFVGYWMGVLINAEDLYEAPVAYELDCPRCGTTQQGVTGSHHCTRCSLAITVLVR
jgi:hypothetical protein